MTRVKRGVVARRRHKKVLEQTRGYKLGRKNLFKQAKQALLKAGQHSYRDRRNKKRDFRRLQIVQLNAAVRSHGLPYKDFILGLRLANLALNRKVLAELSIKDEASFKLVTNKVKLALVAKKERS